MLAVTTPQRAQVGAVAQVAADQFHSLARVMRPGLDLRSGRPFGEALAATQQA
ncbi:hypothetical protein D3C78_1947440 [compost metagenome]